ncbi:MBL fold metallo-hydrolase [bacterium]|nr:MBL fold metallo-hydrolase [bacterium]
MKAATAGLLCAVLLWALLSGCAQQQTEEPEVEVYQYNDHLYKLTHDEPFSVNLYVSVGEDGILVVDTGLPLQTQDLYEALREISPSPIRYVVLTHSHPDHTGGLERFGEDATLIAHENALMQEFFHLPPNPLFDGKTKAVSEPLSMEFNGEEIAFIPLEPAHSNDEILVHFKGSNLLCTGSSILPNGFIFVDWNRDGSLDASYDRIEMLTQEYADVPFAPAHGEDMDSRATRAWMNEMRKSQAAVESKLNEGLSVDSILATDALEPWDDYTNFPNADRFWAATVARHNGIFEEPIPPVVEPMTAVLEEEGVQAAIKRYYKLQSKSPDAYRFGERQLNLLGYQLLYRDRVDEALTVLEENLRLFPLSPNVYDSYGEALLAAGDTARAISYYEKAVEVDSTFENARQVLQTLRTTDDM